MAWGRVNDAIWSRCIQDLSEMVCEPKVGVRSGAGVAAATVMLNVSDAVSPSASVAVHVYWVCVTKTVGVPLTTRVVVSRVTPRGRAGLRL